MIGSVQYGFGFIKNAAADRNIVPRNRQFDTT